MQPITNTPSPSKKKLAKKECEIDEALDVGRIILDNKLQSGDSLEAPAQQQVNNKKKRNNSNVVTAKKETGFSVYRGGAVGRGDGGNSS